MSEIRDYIRESKANETNRSLEETIKDLSNEGFTVEFGRIGEKTTYALVYNEDHSTEYVGYTFIRNLKYYNENTGKLKALQQALARKELLVEN